MGGTGIGGILIVPYLIFITEMDTQPAIASAMFAYIYAFYQSTMWFMSLPDPSNAQAAFISTIVGAGAAFFGLYVGKPSTISTIRRKK